jgi:FkbM family methyltransferase
MKNLETFTALKHKGKNLIFTTPNKFSEWRVKTLLTKEPCTIEWINSFNEKDIFWDVGANIGIYSIYAAIMIGCKVKSFEPESFNYTSLTKNINANKLENLIQGYSIGIDDKSSVGYLGINSFETASSGHIVNRDTSKFKQGCLIFSIDDLIKLGFEQPTHIKINVDGLDYKIINGAKETLKSVKSVLIELDTSNKEHMYVPNIMLDLGFTFDQDQVDLTARKKGDNFESSREYIFIKG